MPTIEIIIGDYSRLTDRASNTERFNITWESLPENEHEDKEIYERRARFMAAGFIGPARLVIVRPLYNISAGKMSFQEWRSLDGQPLQLINFPDGLRLRGVD